MFKPLEMSKVIIIGSTKLLDQTIGTLHDLNVLHITDFREETDPYFKIGKPLEKASYTSEKLLKLRSISNYLGISEVPVEQRLKVEELARNLDKQLTEIDSKVSELLEKRNKIESELKDLAAKEAEIEPFGVLPLEFQLYRGYVNIAVYAGLVRVDIEPKVQEITKEYELFTGSYEGQRMIALFVPKQFEAKIAEVLVGAGFQEIPIPEYEGLPEKILNECRQKGEALLAEKTKIEEEIVKFKEQYATFILASEEYLSIETQKAEAPLRFATTANSFIIDGWIPTEKFELLQSNIQKATDGRVYVQKLEIYEKIHEEHEEHAPTAPADIPVEYKNPKVARPLQLLCDLFSRPTYEEIDPTGIIFITYPLLFGIILGDIAYGAMILAMGAFLKLKSKEEWLQWLGTIGIYAGVFSIIMGVVYAEIFGPNFDPITSHGAIHVGGFVWHAIIDRAEGEGIKMLLGVTILVGVVHLIIGLSSGFKNEIKHHGFKKAFLEKISWIVLLVGGVMAGLKAVPAMIEKHPMPTSDPVFLAGGVIAIVGVIMIVLGEGGMGLVHIPGIMSNCLSYTRLCAVGLSSVFIAYATNMMAIDMCIKAHPGDIVFLILGLFTFISMHALNALLGILAPGLHALRLHYVEFFTKFYKGGGKKYSPFGYIRKYTEE
ncbi:MAG: V-type ATP synthase subunit I [Methanocellales archaeon]